MKTLGLLPDSFFYPAFSEIGYTLNPLAVHPRYELDKSEPLSFFNEPKDKTAESIRFGGAMFKKLIEIETYEYHPFLDYHAQNVKDKREWVESLILLITNNKELFISHRGVEHYAFLFEIVNDHFSALNTPLMEPVTDGCETCRHRIIVNIKHDADFLEHLHGPEKKYFCLKLEKDLRQFANFMNFSMGNSFLEDLKSDNAMIDIRAQLMEELNNGHEKKELADITSLKKIKVNCSAVEFGKIFGDFIKNTRNENGDYLFDYDNSTLARLIVRNFHFNFGGQVSEKTMQGYLLSVRIKDGKFYKRGPGR